MRRIWRVPEVGMARAPHITRCALMFSAFLFSACGADDSGDTSNPSSPVLTPDASAAPSGPGAGGTQAGAGAPQGGAVSVPGTSSPGAVPNVTPVGAGTTAGGATQGGVA